MHLADLQTWNFWEGQEVQGAAETTAGTKFTKWFEANIKLAVASHFEYVQFPQYFTWSEDKKKGKDRGSMHVKQVDSEVSNCSTQ